MSLKSSLVIVACVSVVAPAAAQQPQASVPILAQAYDRCMTTFAVRLTKTAATDEEIFGEAIRSCLPLKTQLTGAILAQLPAAEANKIVQVIDAQAKPSFVSMLAKIRADRAARPSG